MKRLAVCFGVLLVLAGCSVVRVTYRLTIRSEDTEMRSALIAATKRVVTRRLRAMGEDASVIDVNTKNGEIFLSVDIADPIVGETLSAALTDPFTLRIMKQVDPPGDITVEGHGSFGETGITGGNLLWVVAGTDPNKKGYVELKFNQEGRNLIGKVFAENYGKFIGVFVRKHMMSKLLVEATEVKDAIIISDIPSPILAEIFADDTNVGLYVTFTPEK